MEVLSISKSFSFLLLVFLVASCFTDNRSDALPPLPPDEVQTLKTISDKLNNTYWNISHSSCGQSSMDQGNSSGFNTTILAAVSFSNVSCNCSFNNNTVCHVTNIMLKGLNLSGVLPDEFGDLTYLQEIDLSRNYIYGSIPAGLARLNLTILSLLGNRIDGTIPKEIGDIATLKELVLQDNQLGGSLPGELGNLASLERLILCGNNFNRSIPTSFAELKNLKQFRIDGNSLSGKIPDFIGNWKNITRLDMQGTSLEGPIPSSISQLNKLEELRISDLHVSTMIFPNLTGLTKLKRLVLRNCSIHDSLPEYLLDRDTLKVLDLSFNSLTGRVGGTADSTENLDYLFLTNNKLSGAIPDWILDSNQRFDVSYNYFNESSPPENVCVLSEVNLVSSYSSSQNQSIFWCLKKDLPCPSKPRYHSLYINCGGKSIKYEGKEYEEDLTRMGASYFFIAPSKKWAYSSTGYFTDNAQTKYIAIDPKLPNWSYYQTARLAPISLKYYGLCLRKGNYTVELHFAEIMISDDQTYRSVGRRIFDVSIQGKVVLSDFNIMEESRLRNERGINMKFGNIFVNKSTLEIHLYWAGKGTTAIPQRSVYGPLISAIKVTPEFDVDTGLSAGAIVGIVAAACVLLALILVVLRMKGFLGGKDLEDKVSTNRPHGR